MYAKIEKRPGDYVLFLKRVRAKEKKVNALKKIKEPAKLRGCHVYQVGPNGELYYSDTPNLQSFQDWLKVASHVELAANYILYNPIIEVKMLSEDWYSIKPFPAVPGITPVTYFLNGQNVDVVLNLGNDTLKETFNISEVMNTLFHTGVIEPRLTYENGKIMTRIIARNNEDLNDSTETVIRAYEELMRKKLESCNGSFEEVFLCLKKDIVTRDPYHTVYIEFLAAEKSPEFERVGKGISLLWDYLDNKTVKKILYELEKRVLNVSTKI